MTLDRHDLARLKQLLLARDAEQIHQGIELIRSLGDASVVDQFLDGVTWDPMLTTFRGRWASRFLNGSLRPNALFEDTAPARPWHLIAMLGLVSTGLGKKARALANKATVLGVAREEACDLTLLSGFTALTTLSIDAASIENLEVLATMPALTTLSLYSAETLDLSALRGCTALRTLVVESQKQLVGLEGLGALPPLDSLRLASQNQQLAGIEGLTARSVQLDLHAVSDLDALGRTTIDELSLQARTIARLGRLSPSLVKLTLTGGAMVTDRTLPPLPLLRELIHPCSQDGVLVPTLETTPAFERLYAPQQTLRAYGELAKLPKLRSVEVMSLVPEMEALRGHSTLEMIVARGHHVPLASFETMPEVALWQGYGETDRETLRLDYALLENLRGIGRFGAVKTLGLRASKKLTTLDGIEVLTSLEVLDLRECSALTDVSALATLDALRVILVAGVLAADEEFPEAVRWTVTRALKPDVETLRKRTKPARTKASAARKAPAKGPLAEVWAGIELGLRAIPIQADTIADLCRTSGDLSLYNTLLQGVSVRDDAIVMPMKLARGGRTAAKAHLVRRLIAEAPAACTEAVQVRERVEKLRLVGSDEVRRRRWESRGTIDLSPLAMFSALESLTVEDTTGVVGLAALAKARALRTVNFGWGVVLEDLQPLAGSTIEHLSMQSNLRELAGVAEIPLKSLSLQALQGSQEPLKGCALLESLSLGYSQNIAKAQPLAFYRSLPKLQHFSGPTSGNDLRGVPPALTKLDTREEITRTTGASEAEGLREWVASGYMTDCRELPPNLTQWTVTLQNGCVIDGPPHEALRELSVGLTGSMVDLAWVTRFVGLRTLRVRGLIPTSVAPLLKLPALESVYLEAWGQEYPDMTSLDAHPTLQRVVAPWAKAETIPARLRGG